MKNSPSENPTNGGRLQPSSESPRPFTRRELMQIILASMPPVEGNTEEERLEAASERAVRAWEKAEMYLSRFDSPERQAQGFAAILNARGDTYQIADPECLVPASKSALVYLENKHTVIYKTAMGLLKAIDALNVWLESNRDEIKKWSDTKSYPKSIVTRVEYNKSGIRATLKPGTKPSIGVNTAALSCFISIQNLEMFVQLRGLKEAWDARAKRTKRLSNKS